MRILFDPGTPVPLRSFLEAHCVETAYERGWSTLGNGELLAAAEEDGFVILTTTDLILKYQQDLTRRTIAVVLLNSPSWPRIQQATELVVEVVANAAPGSYAEVTIPRVRRRSQW